jgi:flagellar hook-associated protein 1 FlgK
MPNLLTTLLSTANALNVFDRALAVSQNNVTNASTPGYAAQRLSLQAMDFQPEMGLVGGVRSGEIESARNEYAETNVQTQFAAYGFYEQQVATLEDIEPVFDISGNGGIPAALSALFQSFSAWSVAPNDAVARQTVIDRAQEVADSFQQAAQDLATASQDTDRQIQDTVKQINQLGQQLLAYNMERRRGAKDAGLDARIHNTLEELSELTDFTVLQQADGSLTVLLGGQTPLVVGEHFYELGLQFYSPSDPPPTYPGALPTAHLLNAEGKEITGQISQGKLGGLLQVRNNLLSSLLGEGNQMGDLNRLAKAVADRINSILASGQVSSGPPPQPGVPLFTYDSGNDTTIAQSLRLDPGIRQDLLAAIDPGPPYTANGIALKLAALATPQDEADKLDGFGYAEFYGVLAARVGRMLSNARDGKDFKAQTLAQARSIRSELSGVSLDEEAILMTEFQRAYQANAKVISVLNDLMDTAIHLID